MALVLTGYNAGIIVTPDNGDVQAPTFATKHEAAGTGTAAHAHDEATVDLDAPIVHLFGSEFDFNPVDLEVKAGHAFTIMFRNEGLIEHAVTIEGEEGQGGIHLQPGEQGMATFELHEPGTYIFYCGVPGHRDAGMVGTLVVDADNMAVHTGDMTSEPGAMGSMEDVDIHTGDMTMPSAESTPVVR